MARVSVPASCVRSDLVKQWLKGCVTRKLLFRSDDNQKSLRYVRGHNSEMLNRVLHSDESIFEVFSSRRRQYLRPNFKCLQPTIKHSSGSVLVWGCISTNRTTITEKLNGKRYRDILRYHTAINWTQFYVSTWKCTKYSFRVVTSVYKNVKTKQSWKADVAVGRIA